jgi:hypothetical protein
MNSTVTRLALAICAAIAIGCGGRDEAKNDVMPPAELTPGEAAGTSGTNDQLITLTGCVTKAQPSGFVLTSDDEAMLRQETGTSGHHRDDKKTSPTEANRGSEDERLRHAQNPSAELGRFRLEGDADRIAMLVNREVEIKGHMHSGDSENTTPATVRIETIDATGPRCGN